MKEESPIVFISCLGLRETTPDQSQKVDKGISIDKERCQYIKKMFTYCFHGKWSAKQLELMASCSCAKAGKQHTRARKRLGKERSDTT